MKPGDNLLCKYKPDINIDGDGSIKHFIYGDTYEIVHVSDNYVDVKGNHWDIKFSINNPSFSYPYIYNFFYTPNEIRLIKLNSL